MADFRIVCVEKEHGHIIAVGTGTDPAAAERRWTVAEVRAAITKGDLFHTVGTNGVKAYVEKFDGIRTKPDHIKNDNLDAQRVCSWKK
jgi:hypothetical protein